MTKKRGRPSILTEQRWQDYVAAKQLGGTDTDAAYAAGIHPETIRRWRKRLETCDPHIDPDTGELTTWTDDGSTPTIPDLFGFFEDVKKGEAVARTMRLGQIDDAARTGTWQAAAWWLERRFPDEYGRRERRDLHVTALQHETTGEVDPDDSERIEAIAEVLAEVLGED